MTVRRKPKSLKDFKNPLIWSFILISIELVFIVLGVIKNDAHALKFGIVGIIFGGIGPAFVCYKILSPKPLLKITENGIYDLSDSKVKFIPWNIIKDIRLVANGFYSNNYTLIGIEIYAPDNLKSYLTPNDYVWLERYEEIDFKPNYLIYWDTDYSSIENGLDLLHTYFTYYSKK